MNSLIQWIIDNKEWVFSGTGVAILAGVAGWIWHRRSGDSLSVSKINSPNLKGLVGKNINVEGNVVVGSLSATDVKEIAQLVFENNFPTLQQTARDEATENMELFAQELSKVVGERLTIDEIQKFSTANVQYLLSKAAEQAARKDEPAKREFLANLITDHVKKSNVEILDQVLGDAIEASIKLNIDQIKILTAQFFFIFSDRKKIVTVNDIKIFLRKFLNKINNVEVTFAKVSGLVTSSSATYEPNFSNFEGSLLEQYKEIFEYETRLLITGDEKEMSLVHSKLELTKEEIGKLAEWNSSRATDLRITAVGTAIAMSYLEAVENENFEWSEWIK